MTKLVFTDVETTGLDALRDAIFEIALIKGEEERVWWIDLSHTELGSANPGALKVNHYYKRRATETYESVGKSVIHQIINLQARPKLAVDIARFTHGCVLAGNTVKFDQQFLEHWLRGHGACPVWDYHVVDVPTFCAGVLTNQAKQAPDYDEDEVRELIVPPFKSANISKALGVPEPGDDEKHTALADARWSKRMWDAVA